MQATLVYASAPTPSPPAFTQLPEKLNLSISAFTSTARRAIQAVAAGCGLRDLQTVASGDKPRVAPAKVSFVLFKFHRMCGHVAVPRLQSSLLISIFPFQMAITNITKQRI